MTVGDLLPLINDNAGVYILVDGRIRSIYNGKDSINPRYNCCEVIQISPRNDTIDIEVKED